MLKRRVLAVERRLADLVGPAEKKLRKVVVFDDDPEPQAGPDEELFIIRIIDTRAEDEATQHAWRGQ
jgi:hypothetical protein